MIDQFLIQRAQAGGGVGDVVEMRGLDGLQQRVQGEGQPGKVNPIIVRGQAFDFIHPDDRSGDDEEKGETDTDPGDGDDSVFGDPFGDSQGKRLGAGHDEGLCPDDWRNGFLFRSTPTV